MAAVVRVSPNLVKTKENIAFFFKLPSLLKSFLGSSSFLCCPHFLFCLHFGCCLSVFRLSSFLVCVDFIGHLPFWVVFIFRAWIVLKNATMVDLCIVNETSCR